MGLIMRNITLGLLITTVAVSAMLGVQSVSYKALEVELEDSKTELADSKALYAAQVEAFDTFAMMKGIPSSMLTVEKRIEIFEALDSALNGCVLK